MAPSPSRTDPMGPLNPGNVVSAALRLCRDRFKAYFTLSIRAYLWLLIPVYGWAKFFVLTGVMARLAFQDVISQPETISDAQRQVEPKLWSFFGLGILIFLIYFAAYLVLLIVAGIGGLLVGFLIGGILSALFSSELGTAFGAVFGVLVGFTIFLIGFVWIVSRIFIAEVVLAIEPTVNASDGIARSWSLTKASVVRIQFVVLAAFLITLPVMLITNYLPQIFLLRAEYGSVAYWTVYLLSLVTSFIGGMIVMPFWQCVKGVLYYDLRSRREGLDLIRQKNPGSEP